MKPFLPMLALVLLTSSAQGQGDFPSSKDIMKPTAEPRAERKISVEAFLKTNDKNADRRLNADECPFAMRPSFRWIDLNHDGYLDETELGAALASWTDTPRNRGNVIANSIRVVADDFLVEVYHNGERVPDDKRTLDREIFGACIETINIEVREGDWLVFNVVNNRLRWGGASYFAVAGLKSGAGVGFVSDTKSGRWSYCDQPENIPAFIALPTFLSSHTVRPIANKWGEGDPEMNRLTDGWKGEAVWGGGRNTWIKYVASSATTLIEPTR